ncbi:cheY-like receiver [Vibrio ishigakensis]|uniref:histidine kinase n=1 Tax=Vibrio ishigakensis TaxID=1481914 RepID=A0A0B8PAQ5_9VIBR|nr:cheY-like receiver [Vibrio ishigakensis]
MITAALIAPKAQQKNVKIKIEMDEDIPGYVRADEQKLRQVAMNLASNAIKFTEAGAVTFKLKVANRSSDKISLYFAVKDTGIGIDESKHEQVFEEFKQESNQTSNEFGGTGLGLAISTKMIEMMGSKIELTSAKGLGCEFYFTLELELEPEQQGSKPLSYSLPPVIYCSEKPSKILIHELNFYHYPLEVVHSIEEILPHISAKAIIILDGTIDISYCTEKYSDNIVIVVRDNSEEKVDFGDSVAGYITLPLLGHRLDHLLKTIQPTQKQVADAPKTKRTSDGMILVVEDNKVNQQVVAVNLKKLGIEYKIANNGAEAVSLYKEHYEKIALILMDCMMPVMDGFEATSTIRAFEKMESLDETNIIALTASILDDDIQRCFDSGMNDYLPKPFRKAVLVEKLEKNIAFQSSASQPSKNEKATSTVTRIHGS